MEYHLADSLSSTDSSYSSYDSLFSYYLFFLAYNYYIKSLINFLSDSVYYGSYISFK